jgi:large conductance mechanosensitive channel
MPPLGFIMGGVDMSDKKWILQAADVTLARPEIALNWGLFVNAIIDFIIVAFAIFVAIKAMNKLKRQAPEPTPTTKLCPYCQSSISIKATRCPHCTSELL